MKPPSLPLFRILPRRLLPALAVLGGAVVLLSCGGCTLTRVAGAYLRSTADFKACTPDPRIACQPGSEALAHAIAPYVDQAVRTVESAHENAFAKPIVIRTYTTQEDFARFSGATGYAEGAVSFGVLHLSPKLLSTPERIPAIVTHEMSHLNLSLTLGTWSWAHLPGWFHEGLATWVSGGGGAETVTAADAWASIRAGQRFTPEDHGSPFSYTNAATYQLKPHMYYRQASLFIAYLHDRDPGAFCTWLGALEQGRTLPDAFDTAYHLRLDALWQDFLGQAR